MDTSQIPGGLPPVYLAPPTPHSGSILASMSTIQTP